METSLIQIVEKSGLEQTKGQILLDRFSAYFSQAAEIEKKLAELTEDDVRQAREIRLALKNSRVEAEKVRKELKESSLREGQTIDSIGRIIKNLIEPLEEKAEKIEKAKEIREAQIKEAKKQERLLMLAKFNVATDANVIADMTDEMFSSYITGVEKDYLERLEAEIKAEEERIAKEKAEAEERERQRLENIRLKVEAEAREKEIAEQMAKVEAEKRAIEEEAKKQREQAEAKLKKEKEAREKIEREIKLKQELEAKAKKEQEEKEEAERLAKEEAEKAALLAPKKEKLTGWIDGFSIGSPVGLDNDLTVSDIRAKFEAFKLWAKNEVKKIK